MNIINHDCSPMLVTYLTYLEPELLILDDSQGPSGLHLLKNSDIPGEGWYCQITTERSLVVYDFKDILGEELLKRVIDKSLYVIFDLSFEPFKKCIDMIYREVVIKHNIPESQIIFLSNMYDATEYTKQVAASFQLNPIKNLWFSALEYLNARDLTPAPNTLEIKPYPKKFLNLNRRWRIHRPLLTILLYYKNLINKGYVSFGPCEQYKTWHDIWKNVVHTVHKNTAISEMVKNSESIKDSPFFYVDTEDLQTNWVRTTPSIESFYEKTYFSVISETTFYYEFTTQNSVFLTEKTFKAIAMKHPFILVTIPNSLAVLRKLGYKTFSPWIDESYDLELDDHKRMLKILHEIERLSNLSEKDLEQFLIAAKEICEYNYMLLKNKQTFIYEL